MNLSLLEHNKHFTVLTTKDDFNRISYYVLDHEAEEAWIIQGKEHFDGMAIIRNMITMMNAFYFFGGRGEFATLDVNLKIGRFVCRFIRRRVPTDYERLNRAILQGRTKRPYESCDDNQEEP